MNLQKPRAANPPYKLPPPLFDARCKACWFVAALLVGLVDTAGRAFITPALRSLAGPATAADVGPALASVRMYLLMAAVLSIKPSGLFPARG